MKKKWYFYKGAKCFLNGSIFYPVWSYYLEKRWQHWLTHIGRQVMNAVRPTSFLEEYTVCM
jgi:hypothetical protein